MQICSIVVIINRIKVNNGHYFGTIINMWPSTRKSSWWTWHQSEIQAEIGAQGDRFSLLVRIDKGIIPLQNKSASYRIAGNFRGRNVYEFCGFRAIRERFLHKIWGCPTHLFDWFSIPRKFSPQKSHFLLIRKTFLLWMFPAIRIHESFLLRMFPSCYMALYSGKHSQQKSFADQ